MNPQIESTNMGLDTCRPEYQQSELSGVCSISSYPLTILRRTALVTTMAVVGTIPVPVEDPDLPYNGIEASFVFPSSSGIVADDAYSRIREEIIAAGIPMLGDEELRLEIKERKGGDVEI
jgi:hypothetical protein